MPEPAQDQKPPRPAGCGHPRVPTAKSCSQPRFKEPPDRWVFDEDDLEMIWADLQVWGGFVDEYRGYLTEHRGENEHFDQMMDVGLVPFCKPCVEAAGMERVRSARDELDIRGFFFCGDGDCAELHSWCEEFVPSVLQIGEAGIWAADAGGLLWHYNAETDYRWDDDDDDDWDDDDDGWGYQLDEDDLDVTLMGAQIEADLKDKEDRDMLLPGLLAEADWQWKQARQRVPAGGVEDLRPCDECEQHVKPGLLPDGSSGVCRPCQAWIARQVEVRERLTRPRSQKQKQGRSKQRHRGRVTDKALRQA